LADVLLLRRHLRRLSKRLRGQQRQEQGSKSTTFHRTTLLHYGKYRPGETPRETPSNAVSLRLGIEHIRQQLTSGGSALSLDSTKRSYCTTGNNFY
jgi:hypothetical protein